MNPLSDQNLSHELPALITSLIDSGTAAGSRAADDGLVSDKVKADKDAIVMLAAILVELAQLRGPSPKVIRLRCGNQPTGFATDLLRRRATAVEAFGINEAACLEI